jgi:predicted metal-dependent enzyme (double-stranded beta helix superfamily)
MASRMGSHPGRQGPEGQTASAKDSFVLMSAGCPHQRTSCISDHFRVHILFYSPNIATEREAFVSADHVDGNPLEQFKALGRSLARSTSPGCLGSCRGGLDNP